MRRRLVIVFLIPLVGVLLVLGTAYAWTAARSIQQSFYTEQLGDLSYLLTSARQSLTSGSPDVFESEAERLHDLYGTHVLVVDRAGALWATSGIDPTAFEESTATQIRLALAGRRSDLPVQTLPWVVSDVVIVEPVFDKGDAIGAVVLSASAEHVQWAIVREWVVLAVVSVLATLLGVFVVNRLANWVLQPVHRVDRAMAAVERGEVDARIDDDTGPPELRSMIQMFNRMAGEIERVLSRQQEFALNASHELRNPLSALLMRVEYLATGLGDEWDDDVEAMREEGRRLTRILDTLLRLAQGGRGDAAFSAVDVTRLVQSRMEAWQQVAAGQGMTFRLDTDRPVLSITDGMVVEGALDAVIDNAVKFSPPGSTVELDVKETAEGCEIVVRDHGPGVAEEELDRITDRFWRSAGEQNTPGSGLGLAIASDLMASVNGHVRVSAAEGGGLEVSLSLERGGVLSEALK